MTREEEFSQVKEIIKKYYDSGDCGIFDTRNIVGDNMTCLFTGKYFIVDICYHWSYFEVFGATSKEFEELRSFYNKLYQAKVV